MVSVVIEKEIPAPAEKVWALLSDFGNISWSGMDNVEVEGEGVGMIRRIIIGPDLAAEERLDKRDAEGMTFTYSILSGNPMPIDNIQGSPRVCAVDEVSCRLIWTVTGQEAGVSESRAAAILTDFYSGLLDTISSAVLAKS